MTPVRAQLLELVALEPAFELVLEQYDLGAAMFPAPFSPRRPPGA